MTSAPAAPLRDGQRQDPGHVQHGVKPHALIDAVNVVGIRLLAQQAPLPHQIRQQRLNLGARREDCT